MLKKSECYKIAQEAVMAVERLDNGVKLEIVRVLMREEDSARWSEEYAERAEQTEEVAE